jgi:hypothetical protein
MVTIMDNTIIVVYCTCDLHRRYHLLTSHNPATQNYVPGQLSKSFKFSLATTVDWCNAGGGGGQLLATVNYQYLRHIIITQLIDHTGDQYIGSKMLNMRQRRIQGAPVKISASFPQENKVRRGPIPSVRSGHSHV